MFYAYNTQVCGFKYFKRLKIFKNYKGSCTFDPVSLESLSYGWWKFTEKRGDFLVFNDYRYSNQTSKHQSKVRQTLGYLNLKIDFTVEYCSGIDRPLAAITDHEQRISSLKCLMAKKGTRKAKNLERIDEIAFLEEQIEVIKAFEANDFKRLREIKESRRARLIEQVIVAKTLADLSAENSYGELETPDWSLRCFIEENAELIQELGLKTLMPTDPNPPKPKQPKRSSLDECDHNECDHECTKVDVLKASDAGSTNIMTNARLNVLDNEITKIGAELEVLDPDNAIESQMIDNRVGRLDSIATEIETSLKNIAPNILKFERKSA